MLCVGYAMSPEFCMEVTGTFTCQELGHMPKIETFVSIVHHGHGSHYVYKLCRLFYLDFLVYKQLCQPLFLKDYTLSYN